MRVGHLDGYTDDQLKIAAELDEPGPASVRIWARLWDCVNARNIEMGGEDDQKLLKEWRDALRALRRHEREQVREPGTGQMVTVDRWLLRHEGGDLMVPEGVYDYAKKLWKRVGPQMSVGLVDDVLLTTEFLTNGMVAMTDEQFKAWQVEHPS
jgi:hypothetical protein